MKVLPVVCGLSVCIACAAQAGVVVQQVEHLQTPASGGDRQSVIYVQNGLVRTERRDSNGRLVNFTLFRDGAIWQFDPGAHTYRKWDRAGIDKMMVQMPPQARVMMEKLRASGSAHHESSWRDTGKTERVGAYTCRVWEGSPAGEKENVCVVPFSVLAGGDELAAALRQMSDAADEIVSALPFRGANLKMSASYSRFNGIPVSSHTATGETRVVNVEKRALSTDLFQVPAGYQPQPLTGR